MSSSSKPEVFIIESLDLSQEKLGFGEGQMLCQLLRMMDKEPLYYYIRTKQELRAMAREFEQSRYRYLHISCHGAPDKFDLSLDAVTFGTFARIFSTLGIAAAIQTALARPGTRAPSGDVTPTDCGSQPF
jgi:hypothetical protein